MISPDARGTPEEPSGVNTKSARSPFATKLEISKHLHIFPLRYQSTRPPSAPPSQPVPAHLSVWPDDELQRGHIGEWKKVSNVAKG